MEDSGGHVDETSGAQHICEVECCIKVHAEGSKACGHVIPELDDWVACRDTVVLRLGPVVDFLEFNPAPWFEMAEHGGHYQWGQRLRNEESQSLQQRSLHQLWPVLDSHYYVPAVDVVEVVFGLQPRAFEVVDCEFDVWRHP